MRSAYGFDPPPPARRSRAIGAGNQPSEPGTWPLASPPVAADRDLPNRCWLYGVYGSTQISQTLARSPDSYDAACAAARLSCEPGSRRRYGRAATLGDSRSPQSVPSNCGLRREPASPILVACEMPTSPDRYTLAQLHSLSPRSRSPIPTWTHAWFAGRLPWTHRSEPCPDRTDVPGQCTFAG